MPWWKDVPSDASDAHRHHVPGAQAFAIDTQKISWLPAVRGAAVPTILAALAVVTGDPKAAVPLAMGALFVGVAEAGLPPGYRWKVMLWTTLWLMVGSGVGHVLAPWGLWGLLGTAPFAFLAGWVGSAGPRAAVAGTVTLANFAIAQGLPEGFFNATQVVLLIGLGGITQTGVMVLSSVLRDPHSLRDHRDAQPIAWKRLARITDTQDLFVRHGLRLMVVFTAATAVSEFVPSQHQYWIPMSVAWMARPDARGTATRILNRVAGTAVGVAVLAGLAAVIPYSSAGVLVVVAVGAYLMLAFIWANYAIAVLGVTIFVLALFDLNRDLTDDTLIMRLAATVFAALITWLGTFLWSSRKVSPTQ